MTSELNEALEDVRIGMEVNALTEDEIYPYLAEALRMCGETRLASTPEGLVEQAVRLVERRRRRRGGGGGGGGGAPPAGGDSKVKAGFKKVFGVLRRIGQPIVKAAAWGAGRALQGAGHVVRELGKGLGDKAAQMNWQPKRRPA